MRPMRFVRDAAVESPEARRVRVAFVSGDAAAAELACSLALHAHEALLAPSAFALRRSGASELAAALASDARLPPLRAAALLADAAAAASAAAEAKPGAGHAVVVSLCAESRAAADKAPQLAGALRLHLGLADAGAPAAALLAELRALVADLPELIALSM